MTHLNIKENCSSRKSGFVFLFGAQGEYSDKHSVKGCNETCPVFCLILPKKLFADLEMKAFIQNYLNLQKKS